MFKITTKGRQELWELEANVLQVPLSVLAQALLNDLGRRYSRNRMPDGLMAIATVVQIPIEEETIPLTMKLPDPDRRVKKLERHSLR
jgi:hypothetical protein